MTTVSNTVQNQLDQAHRKPAAAERFLFARAPGPDELHATVDGAIRISTALADLVATVMRQASTTLDHNSSGSILGDLRADVRAMHGCLTTGPLQPAPARDDLGHLVAHPNPEQAMLEDAPAHDAADQQRPARPEPLDDEQALPGIPDTIAADLADVADQHRNAPVLEEDEPWP
ncbi:hypothetical protein [Amycolatopsis sp. NPDC051903]|uniref:hypothetical protein n=1 Tax=Amycolatopsis sp. NPDC051903 TaxID=3363936 RepID=UPI0037B9458A